MKYHVILLIVVAILSYGYIQAGKGTPRCVKKEIKKFAKNSSCNNSHVDQYSFQSKTVYVFDPGTCGADMQSDVYNSKGKLLGSLGGFRGNVKISGEDFSNAVFVKTVWKKPAERAAAQ